MVKKELLEPLKKWLEEVVPRFNDSEPNVFAEYVLALLGKPLPLDALKQEATEELQDLMEPHSTEAFVNELFEWLRTEGRSAAKTPAHSPREHASSQRSQPSPHSSSYSRTRSPSPHRSRRTPTSTPASSRHTSSVSHSVTPSFHPRSRSHTPERTSSSRPHSRTHSPSSSASRPVISTSVSTPGAAGSSSQRSTPLPSPRLPSSSAAIAPVSLPTSPAVSLPTSPSAAIASAPASTSPSVSLPAPSLPPSSSAQPSSYTPKSRPQSPSQYPPQSQPSPSPPRSPSLSRSPSRSRSRSPGSRTPRSPPPSSHFSPPPASAAAMPRNMMSAEQYQQQQRRMRQRPSQGIDDAQQQYKRQKRDLPTPQPHMIPNASSSRTLTLPLPTPQPPTLPMPQPTNHQQPQTTRQSSGNWQMNNQSMMSTARPNMPIPVQSPNMTLTLPTMTQARPGPNQIAVSVPIQGQVAGMQIQGQASGMSMQSRPQAIGQIGQPIVVPFPGVGQVVSVGTPVQVRSMSGMNPTAISGFAQPIGNQAVAGARVGILSAPGQPVIIQQLRAGSGARPRCKDFDNQGRCMRGDSCPFEHASDSMGLDGMARRTAYPSPPTEQMSPPTMVNQASAGMPMALQYDNSQAWRVRQGKQQMPVLQQQQQHGVDRDRDPRADRARASRTPSGQPSSPQPAFRHAHKQPSDIVETDSINVMPSKPLDLSGRNTPTGLIGQQQTRQSAHSPRQSGASISRPGSAASSEMDSFSEGSDSGGSHRGREGGSAKSGRKKRRKDRERDRADGSGYGEAGQAQTQQGRAFNSSPSLSKLHVVNIPAHLNSMSALSSHFEKFGEVVNIQVLKDTGRAFVQYNTHEQAQRALASEDAVCGNRFIKIYWARPEGADAVPPNPQFGQMSQQGYGPMHAQQHRHRGGEYMPYEQQRQQGWQQESGHGKRAVVFTPPASQQQQHTQQQQPLSLPMPSNQPLTLPMPQAMHAQQQQHRAPYYHQQQQYKRSMSSVSASQAPSSVSASSSTSTTSSTSSPSAPLSSAAPLPSTESSSSGASSSTSSSPSLPAASSQPSGPSSSVPPPLLVSSPSLASSSSSATAVSSPRMDSPTTLRKMQMDVMRGLMVQMQKTKDAEERAVLKQKFEEVSAAIRTGNLKRQEKMSAMVAAKQAQVQQAQAVKASSLTRPAVAQQQHSSPLTDSPHSRIPAGTPGAMSRAMSANVPPTGPTAQMRASADEVERRRARFAGQSPVDKASAGSAQLESTGALTDGSAASAGAVSDSSVPAEEPESYSAEEEEDEDEEEPLDEDRAWKR